MQRIMSSRMRAARLAILVAGLVAALLMLPAEATLGGLIRAIYLHGALLRAGEAAFAGAGIAGLAYLTLRRPVAQRWTWALQRAAALVWAASFAVSSYVTVAAWGSINWSEPRFLASGQILAAAAVALAVGLLLEYPWLRAMLALLLAAFVAMQLASAGLMLHPENPIGTSSSSMLRTSYLLVVVLAVAVMLELAAWFARSPDREEQTSRNNGEPAGSPGQLSSDPRL